MAAEMIRRTKVIKFLKSEAKIYERMVASTKTEEGTSYSDGVLFGMRNMMDALQKEFNILNEELGE